MDLDAFSCTAFPKKNEQIYDLSYLFVGHTYAA